MITLKNQNIISPLKGIRGMFFLTILFFFNTVTAQKFTRADTLRGSITPERAWWVTSHQALSGVMLGGT